MVDIHITNQIESLMDRAGKENLDAVEKASVRPAPIVPAPGVGISKQAPGVSRVPSSEVPDVPSEEVSVYDDLVGIPGQIFGGVEEAFINQGNFVRTGIGFLGQNFEAFNQAEEWVDSLPDIPVFHEAPGPVSGAVREISQFIAGMVLPASKLKAASWFVRGVLSGGVAGSTAFKRDDPGIASIIKDLSSDSENMEAMFNALPKSFQNVLKALPVTPEDSDAMAYMKKFVSEAMVGIPFEAVMGVARAMRAVRHAKKLEDGRTQFDPAANTLRKDLLRADETATKVSLKEGIKAAEKGGGGSIGDAAIPDLRPSDITKLGLKWNEKIGLFDGADRFVDVKSMSFGGKKIDLRALKLDFSGIGDTAALIRAIRSSMAGIKSQLSGKVPGASSEKRAAYTVFEKALKIADSGEEGIATAMEGAIKSTGRTEMDAFFFDIARAAHGNRTYSLVQKTLAGDLAAAAELPRQLAIGAEIEALSRVIKSPLSRSLNRQFDLSQFGFGKDFNKQATDMMVRNAKFIDNFDAADIAVRLKTIKDPIQFTKFTQQSSRAGMFDAFLEVYYNSILSASILPNFIGSHAFLVYQIPVHMLKGVYGSVGKLAAGKLDAGPMIDGAAFAAGYVRSFVNNITTLGRNLGKSAVGMKPDITDSLQKFEAFKQESIAADTFQGAIDAVDKTFRLATRDAVSVKTPLEWLTNVTGSFTRITQNLFASADEFNRRIAWDAHRFSKGHRTLFKANPSKPVKQVGEEVDAVIQHTPKEGIDESAEEFGRMITFTREAEGGFLGTAGLRDSLAEYPVGRLVTPFLRSQADMFSAFIANSPLAVASPNFWKAMNAGGAERQIVLSQLTFASAITYSVHDAWVAGKITGNGPSNYGELKALRKVGWKPLSILVDGDSPNLWILQAASGRDDLFDRPLVPPVYVSYKHLQPFATWMGMMVDSLQVTQRMDDPDEAESAFKMVYEDVASNILDKNFMKGLMTIMGSFNGGQFMDNILPNLMASLAPAAVADYHQTGRAFPIDSRTTDPTQSAEHQAMEKFFKKFRHRMGFDEDAIPNYDGLGQLGILPNSSYGSLFNMDVSGKMAKKYAMLYAHMLNNRFFPRKLDNSISFEGAKVDLTMEQYAEYQRIFGSEEMDGEPPLMDALNELVSSDEFLTSSDGPDGDQLKLLQFVVDAYRDGALEANVLGEFERLEQAADAPPTFDNINENSLKDILQQFQGAGQ